MSEAITNSPYRRKLIVAHTRKLKRVHKLGQYSEVLKFACVYLKQKPSQLSKCLLYRKMMQYGIKLSTKHPSEGRGEGHKRHCCCMYYTIMCSTFCRQYQLVHK